MNGPRRTSIIEIGAVRAPAGQYDVAILGGGLAGLTLAIQLKQARPETNIVVLEKREGPAPLAAFKVGESTVPAGAHYFADVVGMRDHLEGEQLLKLGLRFFPTREANRDITLRPEKGPPDFPQVRTYQLDRGLFENKLAARARALGVDVTHGARVREVNFGADAHTVTFELFGGDASTTSRWVVDAAGRASLLKSKLGLGTDAAHHINSAWFRLSGGLDLEEWGAHDPDWMARMGRPGIRQFSTNHLLGEGYWIWLIPLSTGPISIGVCADPRSHPFERISTFDQMLDWMHQFEPQLAAALEGRFDDVEDFLRVEDFAYGVEQAYSRERWCLVGEAAAFADPFFSPGSDFIGFGNTFTTDLVTRDLCGEDISERLDYYNALYQRTFEFAMARHRDSYALYGNAGVAMETLAWMTPASHSGITLLFGQDRLTDLRFMRSVDEELRRYFELNIRMHDLFRRWNEIAHPDPAMVGIEMLAPPGAFGFGGPAPGGPDAPPAGPPPGFVLPVIVRATIAVFSALLKDFDDDELEAEFSRQMRVLEELAVDIFRRAASTLPESPPSDAPINPYAIGLDPKRWESDGLFLERPA